jgi:hypothetical protein
LERDVVSDFSVPRFWIDCQALITVSKLYTVLLVKEAVEGSEEGSVSSLLKQLKFSKKLIKSARSPAVNHAGKIIMQVSLKGINSLMNRDGCSPEIFSCVFEFLTPITYEEYGSRNGFIGLYLAYDWWFNNQLDKNIERGNIEIGSRLGRVARLFLQTQRTLNYYFAYISKCIDYEKRPPFEWESAQITAESINKGLFWWLRNPAGKLVFSDKNYLKPDLTNRISASIETKIIYELARISAEIHLSHANGEPAEKIPGKLESYRALDPYSGKPYKWSRDKGILYSMGPNRKDDGGEFDPTRHTRNEPPDIVLPCVLRNVRD